MMCLISGKFFLEVFTMEEKKKVALNDELLDNVAGGMQKGMCYICPICGNVHVYPESCDPYSKPAQSKPINQDEPIARA